jgi:hypothetical protein
MNGFSSNLYGKKSFAMKISVIVLFTLLYSIFSSVPVQAIGISVTKAVVEYNNVLKGGYAEDVLYVSTDAPFNIPISYEILGEIQNWTSIDPDLNAPNVTIVINNSNYQPLRIIVKPPADTPVGTYTGNVRILTGTLNTIGGQYGSQLQAAFMIRITIKVTGSEFLSCSGAGVLIKDTEVGGLLDYSMNVFNSGNVRIRPTATIDIWNQDQTKLLMTKQIDFSNQEVLPTTSQVFFNTISNDLRIGQYWAYVTVNPCGNSALATFNVYEKGTIVDSGELIRLDSQAWAKIGDIVPLVAVFKNTGQRTVSAKFKGVITSNNKIVETIDSEFLDVAPGETASITVYFTPKKYGQYIINGRVLYNNKLTFEKSTVVNVNEGVEKTEFNWFYVLILIVIIIVILLLLINIRKKKHSSYRRV